MTSIDSVIASISAAGSAPTPAPVSSPPVEGRGEERNGTAAASARRGDSITLSPEARAAAARGDKDAKPTAETPTATRPDGEPLTEAEREQVDQLKSRDREVRNHEQAHVAAGGSHVTGGPTYEYRNGADGRRYAVGGEVSIDTGVVEGDPAATIRKMEAVRRAALAPAEPSGQDRAVAAKAERAARQARAELAEQKKVERTEADGKRADEMKPDGPVDEGAPATAKSDLPGAATPAPDAAEGPGTPLDLVA